jgi:hypothetical protein
MNLFEDTNPRALKDLLAEVHSLTMALPEFQRDFVWDPSATQELIVSIAHNYPAGSILRVRDGKRVFAARQFEGAPELGGHQHTFLVLDGQQRLTSLYQAFYGVGDHRYYLDLKKLMNGSDFEDAVFNVRTTTKWCREHETLALQARELVLPLSLLRGGSGGFLQWLLQVTNPLEPQARTSMLDALTHINDDWIKVIDDYHFPVVTLSDSTEADALCTIFETLNRTGVKLTAFELLTARFWPQGINLREWWEQARQKHPIVEDFEVDAYYVLQAVALASRKTPSCKRSDVLNMAGDDVRTWWNPVIESLSVALEILRDDCKVLLPKWLPYQTMLSPMAAVLAKTGLPKGPEAGVNREKMKRWFWSAVFGQAYETSSNTQAANDTINLLAWIAGGAVPDTVSAFHFDPNMLKAITPRQRSVYRGAICLILGNLSRDFHTQAVINTNLMRDEYIDDHHVFPAKYLEKVKGIGSARVRDCVLNRTLIDRTTNQMIGDRAPSAYLTQIRDTPGFPLDAVLGSHCLPTGADSPLWANDYDKFLTWRQERLWQEIKRVTGVTEAADLEAQNGVAV